MAEQQWEYFAWDVDNDLGRLNELMRDWASDDAEDNKRAVETGQIGAAHGGQETIDARKAVDPALEEAEAQDQVLIKLICEELRSIPEAARRPSAQPG